MAQHPGLVRGGGISSENKDPRKEAYRGTARADIRGCVKAVIFMPGGAHMRIIVFLMIFL